jgi:AcrR family transcriptional regulator
MASEPVRRRAPGMSPEQRREMIVRAALPLVADRGAAVTTQQVARAAGIGEATVFRVFADKEALLDAVLAEALDTNHALRELASISLDQPLAARLVEAVDALQAHLDRMGSVIGALYVSGHRAGSARPAPGTPARSGDGEAGASGHGRDWTSGRDAAQAATREAVADLFAPDRDRLRMPPETLARVFLGLVSAQGRPTDGGPPVASTEDIVNLFLNGATVHEGNEP